LSDLRLPELGSAAGLLGGQASFSIAGNIQLKGVVVAGDPSESVAILAINGQPSLTVRNRAEAAPGITLQEVHKQHVLLSEGGVIKRVELPVAATLKVR
ncbi:MAG: type II secretion system protein N, partial [Gallionella sp.]|nr:type II secretion system protein N [Gallionella sp.]